MHSKKDKVYEFTCDELRDALETGKDIKGGEGRALLLLRLALDDKLIGGDITSALSGKVIKKIIYGKSFINIIPYRIL